MAGAVGIATFMAFAWSMYMEFIFITTENGLARNYNNNNTTTKNENKKQKTSMNELSILITQTHTHIYIIYIILLLLFFLHVTYNVSSLSHTCVYSSIFCSFLLVAPAVVFFFFSFFDLRFSCFGRSYPTYLI